MTRILNESAYRRVGTLTECGLGQRLRDNRTADSETVTHGELPLIDEPESSIVQFLSESAGCCLYSAPTDSVNTLDPYTTYAVLKSERYGNCCRAMFATRESPLLNSPPKEEQPLPEPGMAIRNQSLSRVVSMC